jgi:hypothetical protein
MNFGRYSFKRVNIQAETYKISIKIDWFNALIDMFVLSFQKKINT